MEYNIKGIKFPMGFKFEEVDNNILHIISNSGSTYFETPTMHYIKYASVLIILLGILLGSGYYNLRINDYVIINTNVSVLFSFSIVIIGVILAAIYVTNTSVKTDFYISPDGIKIESKKGTVFIEKNNISKIYFKQFNSENFVYYNIFLTCKNDIYLEVAKKYKKEISLFCDDYFTNLITVEYIIHKFNKTLELNKI